MTRCICNRGKLHPVMNKVYIRITNGKKRKEKYIQVGYYCRNCDRLIDMEG